MTRIGTWLLRGILFLATLPSAQADESAAPAGVQELDDDSYRLVEESHDVWVIQFHSGMCGTCQTFQPTWRAVAEELRERLRLGSVNVDLEAGSSLAQRLNAFENGIPSIAVVLPERTDMLIKVFAWDGVDQPPQAADIVTAIQAAIPGSREQLLGNVWVVSGAAVLIFILCSLERCRSDAKRPAGRWLRWLSRGAAVVILLRIMMLPNVPVVLWS
mmetsp:Transcript_15467/g.37174  ORF Transcript_15467/g.37174 Transcript_15467/m.37174 type:complete len:216 (+) Transcript_15467:34-681(+)